MTAGRALALALALLVAGPGAAQVPAACRALEALSERGRLPEPWAAQGAEIAALAASGNGARCAAIASEIGLRIVDTGGPSACAALGNLVAFGALREAAGQAERLARTARAGTGEACGAALHGLGLGRGAGVPDCAAILREFESDRVPLRLMPEAGGILRLALAGDDPGSCTARLADIRAGG